MGYYNGSFAGGGARRCRRGSSGTPGSLSGRSCEAGVFEKGLQSPSGTTGRWPRSSGACSSGSPGSPFTTRWWGSCWASWASAHQVVRGLGPDTGRRYHASHRGRGYQNVQYLPDQVWRFPNGRRRRQSGPTGRSPASSSGKRLPLRRLLGVGPVRAEAVAQADIPCVPFESHYGRLDSKRTTGTGFLSLLVQSLEMLSHCPSVNRGVRGGAPGRIFGNDPKLRPTVWWRDVELRQPGRLEDEVRAVGQNSTSPSSRPDVWVSGRHALVSLLCCSGARIRVLAEGACDPPPYVRRPQQKGAGVREQAGWSPGERGRAKAPEGEGKPPLHRRGPLQEEPGGAVQREQERHWDMPPLQPGQVRLREGTREMP